VLQVAALVLGIVLGALSGLVPGIHSNTVASLLAGFSISPESAPFIIVALVGAHIVFQFFPSIFLSIPDDTVVASVLPGHRMALEGRGTEALAICAFSVLIAAGASALLLPVSMWLLPTLYSLVEPNISAILVLASVYLVASEREPKKIAAAVFIFLLSGALGVVTLRGAVNDPLFPSFCGLFAVSGILLSFTATRKIPEQKEGKTKLDFLPYVLAGVLLGMLSDLLPGIAAPAQIAIFASAFLVTDDARKFLALVASIAASHAVFAFSALLSIGKAREGALAILNDVSPVLPSQLPSLVGTLLLAMGVGALALIWLSKRTHFLSRLEMKDVNLGVLAYLVCAVAIISGTLGILTLATAAAIGILPPLLGIRRTHVMGLIIVPSMLLGM